MKNNFIRNNKGYTLLFAVLVSSIVLAVGISILTISKKEYLLSSSARESTAAFYAADSGLECAMYYTQGVYGSNFATTTGTANLNCFGKTYSNLPIVGTNLPITLNGDTFEFDIKTGSDSSACAIVTVQQHTKFDSALGTIPVTTIISKGYNLGWNNSSNTCTDPSPKRVERAIEYTF